MYSAAFVLIGFLLSQQEMISARSSPSGDPTARAPADDHAAHVHGHVAPTKSPVEVFNEQVRHEVHHLYATFDLNHDGALTKEDLSLYLRFYDSDGNGTTEREEYEQNFDMQEPTLALVAGDLFREFDSDSNSHIDMSDMSSLYSRMDLNKDGQVDHREFEEYMTEVMTLLVILHLQGQEFS